MTACNERGESRLQPDRATSDMRCDEFVELVRHTISALADLPAEALPDALRDALLNTLRGTGH